MFTRVFNQTGQFDVSYPSGRKFSLNGRLHVAEMGDPPFETPMIDDLDTKRTTALDPRAVIRFGPLVVYTPRLNMDRLDPSMVKWLIENPEWPPKATK